MVGAIWAGCVRFVNGLLWKLNELDGELGFQIEEFLLALGESGSRLKRD